MEEQKERLLELVDSLEKENIELALEISKGLGLTTWLVYEITSTYNYLYRFLYTVQCDLYHLRRYSTLFNQYVSFTPACLNPQKKLVSELRENAGLLSRYIAWG